MENTRIIPMMMEEPTADTIRRQNYNRYNNPNSCKQNPSKLFCIKLRALTDEAA